MRKKRYQVNEVDQCIQLAKLSKDRILDIRQIERRLCQAFISLADDEFTGLLAFGIWRGRSNMPTYMQKGI